MTYQDAEASNIKHNKPCKLKILFSKETHWTKVLELSLLPTAIQNEEQTCSWNLQVELQVFNLVLKSSNLATLATGNLKLDQKLFLFWASQWLEDLDNHLIHKGIKQQAPLQQSAG